MKLGPVTNLDERNTVTPKNDNDVMCENCDIIGFFRIYGQFQAIGKPDFGRMVYKTYIFNNTNLISYKTSKQNQKICNTTQRYYFCQKLLVFCKKNADISKIKGF